MKYIRTKDGKIIAEEQIDLAIKISNVVNIFDETEILKQADTIEELCDEFVIVHKELNGNHTVHRYNWLGKSEHEVGNEVYGAVWTDKGLIYVAKMNDKGELELL